MSKFLKSKLGFTLVELIVVIMILSVLVAIAIPAYSAVNKKSRIKVCKTTQKEIHANVKNYCVDTGFNNDYSFKIQSSAEEETGKLLNSSGKEFAEESEKNLLLNEVFKGEIPYCPADGTYTINVKRVVGGIPKVEVVCDGDEGEH